MSENVHYNTVTTGKNGNYISISKRMKKLWHNETIKYHIKVKIELHIPKILRKIKC